MTSRFLCQSPIVRVSARVLTLIFLLSVLVGCQRPKDPAVVVVKAKDGWGFDYAAYSPDGRHLAFFGVHDGDDRVGLAKDGMPRAITSGDILPTDFAWMPDSKKLLIAFRGNTLDDEGRLQEVTDQFGIFDLRGKLLSEVTLQTPVSIRQGMSVRSDGVVAVVAMAPPGIDAQVDADAQVDLGEITLHTGAVRNLTNTPQDDEDQPLYLTDQRILFVTSTETEVGFVESLDLVTGARTRLTPKSHDVVDFSASLKNGLLVFSGTQVPERGEGDGLYYMKLEGGPVRRLGKTEWTAPAFLPNGLRILVVDPGHPERLGSWPGPLSTIEVPKDLRDKPP